MARERRETDILPPAQAVLQANNMIPDTGQGIAGTIFTVYGGGIKICWLVKKLSAGVKSDKFTIGTDFNTFNYAASKERIGIISGTQQYFIGIE